MQSPSLDSAALKQGSPGVDASLERLIPECHSQEDFVYAILDLSECNQWFITCPVFQIAHFTKSYHVANTLVLNILNELGFCFHDEKIHHKTRDWELDDVLKVETFKGDETDEEEERERNKLVQELKEVRKKLEKENAWDWDRSKVKMEAEAKEAEAKKRAEEAMQLELGLGAVFGAVEGRTRKLEMALPIPKGICFEARDYDEMFEDTKKKFSCVEEYMRAAKKHVASSVTIHASCEARRWQIERDEKKWLFKAWYSLAEQDSDFAAKLLNTTDLSCLSCPVLSDVRKRLEIVRELEAPEESKKRAREDQQSSEAKKARNHAS